MQVDSSLYVIGGRNHEGNLSSCDKYLEDSDEWESLPPLPKALRFESRENEAESIRRYNVIPLFMFRSCCAISFRGKLYVFGGESEKPISKKSARGRAELNRQTFW